MKIYSSLWKADDWAKGWLGEDKLKEFQDLDAFQYGRLSWVCHGYTIYNYCIGRVHFPSLPPECKRDRDVLNLEVMVGPEGVSES
ncbi:putative xyloglucan endotransglucosylase/hydrolase protein 5 [Quercus suber]|uniref:Xyloglucan endotransglucosylase/hydrolase protein 5 n=1 Tax=Quercus suber TaxID=58331 RepID=A0AAW0IQ96_QUESU